MYSIHMIFIEFVIYWYDEHSDIFMTSIDYFKEQTKKELKNLLKPKIKSV